MIRRKRLFLPVDLRYTVSFEKPQPWAWRAEVRRWEVWEAEDRMKQLVLRLWHDEAGQDLAEYTILIVLIAIAAIGAVGLVGTQVTQVFMDAGNQLPAP